MMHETLETSWLRRTKWLTQALMISGTLNIGLLATFAYFVLKDKQIAVAPSSTPKETPSSLTNAQLLTSYSLLSYPELLLRLENKDLIEEGLTRRDLALSCLSAFHYFDIERALGGAPLQKRQIPFSSTSLPLYPGLSDAQFQALLHFARTEKWPLTSEGLFLALEQTKDPSLFEAIAHTPEFHTLQALFAQTGAHVPSDALLPLLIEGGRGVLTTLSGPPTLEQRRALLTSLLTSPQAAQLLLQTDLEFALKRLDDAQILTLLASLPKNAPELQTFAKELLNSPRTDPVHQRAAALLGQEPSPKIETPKKFHTIEPGDSLWKISRKYKVSVEELKRLNHLETETVRPGRQLEIP